MPIFRKGNMWSAWNSAALFLITTNATLKWDGALVMGAGIAKEAKQRFPGIDYAFGENLCVNYHDLKHSTTTKYGLLISPQWPEKKLGGFQTKYHWKNPASLELIEYSTEMLNVFVWENFKAGDRCHLNFPGIGYGGLKRNEVLPIIKTLPDCIHIWEKA